MFALFSRILKLSGHYKSRIQGAFVCAFLESILSKMPIFLAFVVLSGFANKTITGQTCLYVGLGLAAIVLVQMLVHYLSDSLQSAAGYLMFADKRIELGGHLRKLPMGYFTSGNIGKISSVLSTDMVFIEEVAMSTLGNMMSYQRRLSRHKAQYSLDCDDGIEYSACLHEPTPQELLERMETFLRLWNALNSLPEIQGRRIDAHIILGKSIKEIAEAEGVHEESIRQSIKRGLERMKKTF